MSNTRKLGTVIISVLVLMILCISVILLHKYADENDFTTTETENTATVTITETDSITETVSQTVTETESTVVESETKETVDVTKFVPSPKLSDEQKRMITETATVEVTVEEGYISPQEFRIAGVVYDDTYRYTWYSENVKPGGGLDIPGRYSDGNYVRDEDGYIVLASSELPKGTVINTPLGDGKIYDSGCAYGTIDVYTSF